MRNLPQPELSSVAEHLTECAACQAEFVSTLRGQREDSDLSFTLAPEFWLRNDHLDYAQLVDLAENKLDAADREPIDAHLKVCQVCQEDVTSFLAFRKQIAPELKISYAPIQKEQRHKASSVSWWHGLRWKPIYSAVIVVIGIALVIGAALLLNRRPENQQAQNQPTPQVSPTLSPDSRTASVPTPTSSESPPPEKQSSAPFISLNDSSGAISVDRSGNIFGLDNVPTSSRDEIKQTLIAENITPPAILKELGGNEGSLRGGSTKQPFTLKSPLRTVILSDRPVFSWNKMPGAISYTVYVTDASGREVSRSEAMPSESTQWHLPKTLPRGQVYSWSVVAIVNGKEIVSPGSSSPEVRFQVLSNNRLKQLNQVKATRSHLALGVFYAKVGMTFEAEREFKVVLQLNPTSELARKLLQSAQLLHKSR